MKFDDARIELQPMWAGDCMDLSVRAARQNFAGLAAGYLLICAPLCVVNYFWIRDLGGNLVATYLLFQLAALLFGVYVTAGIARAAFGVPFTLRTVRDWFLADRGGTLLSVSAWRFLCLVVGPLPVIGVASLIEETPLKILWLAFGMLLLIPSMILDIRGGFRTEDRVLRGLERQMHHRGIRELVKQDTSELVVRRCLLGIVGVVIAVVLFVTFDTLWGIMFRWSPLLNRTDTTLLYLDNPGDVILYYLRFFWDDQFVLTVILGISLFVYGLLRMAWFFCYIDLRIRRDLWDVELQILQESERLGATS